MTESLPTYAIVTPVRNEAANIERLCAAIAAQTMRPESWIVVDTGSTDETQAIVAGLMAEHAWIHTTTLGDEPGLQRGGPIARAFEAGYATLASVPDVIVKLDADVSFDETYFAQLLAEFAADERLGMASGTCTELVDGEWRERHVTGTTVWGAARMYRRECLRDVLPLERRMGWDGVDEFRANSRGWRTQTCKTIPFRHHRPEGARDGSQRLARAAQGRAAWYLGYRFWYLAVRALWHARREPAAVAMIGGYLGSAVRRAEQLQDDEARRYIRRQQSIRLLPARAAEAAGRRPAHD